MSINLLLFKPNRIHATWELVRNAKSLVSPRSLGQNVHFHKIPGSSACRAEFEKHCHLLMLKSPNSIIYLDLKSHTQP
jgi:hypothetical protein